MREIPSSQLQSLQLDILRQFDSYCTEKKLTYFLYAGTLIGAIRHKGFIPWDDDIDVMMPRPDYERLRALARTEPVGPYLELRSAETHEGHNAPFFKLADVRTDGRENYLREDIHCGIWIDIFPVDGLPADERERSAFIAEQEKEQQLLRYACRPFDFTWNPLRMAKRLYLHLRYRHLNYRQIAARLDENARKYPYDSSDAVCVSVFDAATRVFKREWFDETVRVPFEGHAFAAPARYDEVLTSMFGDYMTPPPEDQRISHHGYSAWWVDDVPEKENLG